MTMPARTWVMAALAAARHDFAGALRDGERARRLDPYGEPSTA